MAALPAFGQPHILPQTLMHFYSFHPGDYSLDTLHLQPLEDLAYRRLLDLYYSSERPIPLETESVSRRLRLPDKVVLPVLREFFEERPDGWHQARCDAEIANYQERAARARENGKAGGRPKKQGRKPGRLQFGSQPEPEGNPALTGSKANHEPGTINHLSPPVVPKGTKSGPDDAALCEAIYALYPKKVGKSAALKAIAKAIQTSGLTELEMQGKVREFAQAVSLWPSEDNPKFVPHPATWFNQGRYMDDPATWRRGNPSSQDTRFSAEKKERGPAALEPEWDWRAVAENLGWSLTVERWDELPKSARFELRQEWAKKNEGGPVA